MTEANNKPAADSPGPKHDQCEGEALRQELHDVQGGVEKNSSGPESTLHTKLISQRKLEANRANAKRSTGPRTARGKAHSRRNAVRYGLTSSAVLFHPDGAPCDPELRQLWQSLHDKFGSGDATDALIEKVVAEWAHQVAASRLEGYFFEMAASPYDSKKGLTNFHRYLTKSQRTLLRTLPLLQRKVTATSKSCKLRTAPRLTRVEVGPDDPRTPGLDAPRCAEREV